MYRPVSNRDRRQNSRQPEVKGLRLKSEVRIQLREDDLRTAAIMRRTGGRMGRLLAVATAVIRVLVSVLYLSHLRSVMALMLLRRNRQPVLTHARAVNALQREANAYHEKVSRKPGGESLDEGTVLHGAKITV